MTQLELSAALAMEGYSLRLADNEGSYWFAVTRIINGSRHTYSARLPLDIAEEGIERQKQAVSEWLTDLTNH